MRPHKYCQKASDVPLPKDAHINDVDAKLMRRGQHPVNEEVTTNEIYAAAEAIREVRPRNPVGYEHHAAVIPEGASFGLPVNSRQRR